MTKDAVQEESRSLPLILPLMLFRITFASSFVFLSMKMFLVKVHAYTNRTRQRYKCVVVSASFLCTTALQIRNGIQSNTTRSYVSWTVCQFEDIDHTPYQSVSSRFFRHLALMHNRMLGLVASDRTQCGRYG